MFLRRLLWSLCCKLLVHREAGSLNVLRIAYTKPSSTILTVFVLTVDGTEMCTLDRSNRKVTKYIRGQ